MKNKTFLVLVLLSLLIAGCQTSSRPPMQNLFRLNFQEGKTYEYELSGKMDQVIKGSVNSFTYTSLYSVSIAENVGHDKILTGTYGNLKMNMNVMGFTSEIDTEKPLPPPGASDSLAFLKRTFHGMVGKSFKMKVSSDGEILWVKGMDEIAEAMIDSLGLDDKSGKFIVKELKNMFNNEAIREQFVQVFAIFPNKVVKVGDTWDKSYTIATNVPARITNSYKVIAIDGNLVTLDLKGQFAPTDTLNDNLRMKGAVSGTIIADSRWGLVIEGDFNQDIAVKNGEITAGIKGYMKIRGKESEK